MSELREKPSHGHGANPGAALCRSVDGLRRAALAALAERGATSGADRAIAWLHAQPTEQVAQAFADDQVDQIFLHAAQTGGLAEHLPTRLIELLAARRMWVAANVLRQEHVLSQASALLDEAGMAHIVFKGALVRQMLYAKPYLRPSADVDLLVAPADVSRAAKLFDRHDYNVTTAAHSDTHEMWIERLGVGIDLHWSLLRPGRMRRDITTEILANRVRRGGLWSPSDAHLTVAMLVHPAITDHVTGRLISAVDLDRWLRLQPTPWDEVVAMLDRMGLRTAAWAMLRWTNALFDSPVPEQTWRALAPSLLRARYLEAWLARHPGSLYFRQPWLVRGAFSLALQDRASDAARALWKLARKARRVL